MNNTFQDYGLIHQKLMTKSTNNIFSHFMEEFHNIDDSIIKQLGSLVGIINFNDKIFSV